MATSIEAYNDGGYYATLLIGEDERRSAKLRRQQNYSQDLELQMREKNAAKQREKLQDMSVDASGWLDPEKGPERLKPLGGHDFLTTRRVRESRAKPYHTLFALDQPKKQVAGQAVIRPGPPVKIMQPERARPVRVIDSLSTSPRPVRVNKVWARPGHTNVPPMAIERQSYIPQPQARAMSVPSLGLLEPPRRNLDPHPGIYYQPPTYPATNLSYDPGMMAGHMMPATAPVNLVPPLTITQSSPRPIIINHQPIDTGQSPRYNPFQNNSGIMEIKSVLQMSMLENDRMRVRLERENADHRRRLERDREAEQRRQRDMEAEHRRRMEELRREEERRRLQAERDRREAERIRLLSLHQTKTEYHHAPSPDIRVIRPASPNLHNLDLYRQQLREERRKIEALLNRKTVTQKGLDLRVIKQKRQQVALPPTPQSADLANRNNVTFFSDLKHRDMPHRQIFRGMFPEVPYTNKKLEWQQAALLKQQEEMLRNMSVHVHTEETKEARDRRKWLEMYPWTPNITQGNYGRINTARSLDDKSYNLRTMDDYDGDSLRLRSHRSSSRETLQDDTWLRPSTATM